MSFLAEAAEFVARLEDFRDRPYQDATGTWTIGYGTTFLPNGAPVGPQTSPITETEAKAFMMRDLCAFWDRVSPAVRVPLRQGQRIALLSLTYNIGVTAFRGSTILRLLNEGKQNEAAVAFFDWIMSKGRIVGGLINRRKKECLLFLQSP
ncbi:lysozyme [Candidatus Kirkpatrickella diaphorinae]|uniref:Lysozyme n=1 Tax=Candidatus Kirkpatrickella diaphorinae TaxID=2984322 RepID=A0ABY6GI99_9PROT|nr:lysozyme [Candidatus Kirkpatrickella diaphorinae]UYH50575.1 lysozyme [Candidatus Kirkpatrickella diaphorinae]